MPQSDMSRPDDLDRGSQPPADEAKAAEEHRKPTVSQPGGFDNDPDDPTNPNEAIERARRQVRP